MVLRDWTCSQLNCFLNSQWSFIFLRELCIDIMRMLWWLSGLMCELLWSDPHSGVGRAPSKRGVGVAFGSDVTHRFLQENNLGGAFAWASFPFSYMFLVLVISSNIFSVAAKCFTNCIYWFPFVQSELETNPESEPLFWACRSVTDDGFSLLGFGCNRTSGAVSWG